MIDSIATYQLVLLCGIALLCARSIALYIFRKKTFRELLFFITIAAGSVIFVLFPTILQGVAEILGFELGINLLVIICLIILFYAQIKQSLRNDKLENQITRIVRMHALEKLKHGKSSVKQK